MKRKLIRLIICFVIVVAGALSIAVYGLTDTKVYVSSEEALVSAIEKAKDNEVIVLRRDIEVNQELEISCKMTLNLNGHKLANTESVWRKQNGNWSLISVKEGGNLTISGNGLIEAKEDDCYAVDVRGGNLTIEGATFIGNVSAVYVYSGTATISGGFFSIKQLSQFNDYRYSLNCFDANLKNGTASITVTGGAFEYYDPSASDSENPIYNFVAEGYQSIFDGEYYTVEKI